MQPIFRGRILSLWIKVPISPRNAELRRNFNILRWKIKRLGREKSKTGHGEDPQKNTHLVSLEHFPGSNFVVVQDLRFQKNCRKKVDEKLSLQKIITQETNKFKRWNPAIIINQHSNSNLQPGERATNF